MFKELIATDIDIDMLAIQRLVFDTIDSYNSICTNTFNIPYIKDIAPYYPITCEIDVPYGNSKTNLRVAATLTAINAGANTIDLAIPHAMFFLKKYDEFLLDLRSHITLCRSYSTELRIVIENRLYDAETLDSFLSILKELVIDKVVLSTGFYQEDLYDDIILANEIQEKHLLKAIVNKRICNQREIDILTNSGIYGLKSKSIIKS